MQSKSQLTFQWNSSEGANKQCTKSKRCEQGEQSTVNFIHTQSCKGPPERMKRSKESYQHCPCKGLCPPFATSPVPTTTATLFVHPQLPLVMSCHYFPVFSHLSNFTNMAPFSSSPPCSHWPSLGALIILYMNQVSMHNLLHFLLLLADSFLSLFTHHENGPNTNKLCGFSLQANQRPSLVSKVSAQYILPKY